MRSALWPVCAVTGMHSAAKSNLGCVVEFDLSLADGGVTSAVSKGKPWKGVVLLSSEFGGHSNTILSQQTGAETDGKPFLF